MRASNYEKQCRDIYASLAIRFDEANIHCGAKNKIGGISGFLHQIDVSVKYGASLLLIECKCWKKKIDPVTVLAHHSRVLDIQKRNPSMSVRGAIASRRTSTAGVKKLAETYSIELDLVSNIDSYCVRVASVVKAMQTDQSVLGDEVFDRVTKPDGTIVVFS
jgi:hypothetical protein